MQSKWARHRDRASPVSRSVSEHSSSEEEEEEAEDRELERAYQQKLADKKSEEDIFGLDKILS